MQHRVTGCLESTLAILLLAAGARMPAQQPTEDARQQEPARHAPAELMSLRELLTGFVYHVQPLAKPAAEASSSTKEAPGTTYDRAVARIRDAVFDAQGALHALLVDGTERPRAADAPPFVLEAKDVRWDPARRVLVTSLDAARISGLPTEKEKKDDSRARAERQSFRASELLAGRPRCSDSAEGKPANDPPRAIWFAPEPRCLGCLTVESAGKARLLPWSIVRPTEGGEHLTLDLLASRSMVEGAPVVADGAKTPDAETRLACYKHFGKPVPDWEGHAPKEEAKGGSRQR